MRRRVEALMLSIKVSLWRKTPRISLWGCLCFFWGGVVFLFPYSRVSLYDSLFSLGVLPSQISYDICKKNPLVSRQKQQNARGTRGSSKQVTSHVLADHKNHLHPTYQL